MTFGSGWASPSHEPAQIDYDIRGRLEVEDCGLSRGRIFSLGAVTKVWHSGQIGPSCCFALGRGVQMLTSERERLKRRSTEQGVQGHARSRKRL